MRILDLDIETAPNTVHCWGLFNQNIPLTRLLGSGYTMCWSAKWHGTKKVIFDSLYHSPEKQMLKGIHELLDEADVVVHYNGTKFDIPTLNKEFVSNGMLPPSPYKQVDLYRVVRKNFKFPSNKLEYVLEALKVGSKIKGLTYDVWLGCMEGDQKSWKLMERYNKRDVTVLEKLYDRLRPWIQSHPNYGLYSSLDRPVCTNCGSHNLHSRGYSRTKTQMYRRFRCSNCGTWSRSRFTEVDQELRNRILVQEV